MVVIAVNLKFILFILFASKLVFGTLCPPVGLTIRGKSLCVNGTSNGLRGANAMHVFGVGSAGMAAWNMSFSREFIGNLKQQPFYGIWATLDSKGSWLHPVQKVLLDNSNNRIITLVQVFGWDGSQANQTMGKIPSKQSWYSSYKARLAALALAVQSIGGNRAMIGIWNEAFQWNVNTSATVWANEMGSLVDVVRAAGYRGIIVVPVTHMGQGETVLLTHGVSFASGRGDILYDIHAYERWLLDDTTAGVAARLDALLAADIPFIIGETGPMNAGTLMDPRPLLQLAATRSISLAAWLWKSSNSDTDALLLSDGITPNNVNNNYWGTSMQAFCKRLGQYSSASSSKAPVAAPSNFPTTIPTVKPSAASSPNPSAVPTTSPSVNAASPSPSCIPTPIPTALISTMSTAAPTTQSPSLTPTVFPTPLPSAITSTFPSAVQSIVPTPATSSTTTVPTINPSASPSAKFSFASSPSSSCIPTPIPSIQLSTIPTAAPSSSPSSGLTTAPIQSPSLISTAFPTPSPSTTPSTFLSAAKSTVPTPTPSSTPIVSNSTAPTPAPTTTAAAAKSPSVRPTAAPFPLPTRPPSTPPSARPSVQPSLPPTRQPIAAPSETPSRLPTLFPTRPPSTLPSSPPTRIPTTLPSLFPRASPSSIPTRVPSSPPSPAPSRAPSPAPTRVPSATPSKLPTRVPTSPPVRTAFRAMDIDANFNADVTTSTSISTSTPPSKEEAKSAVEDIAVSNPGALFLRKSR